ncbi:MAG TPA: OmpA family protein, partial [Chitinophagaceae bacterium]|nr:OmpA family protein [Chitinophagaceae bacterium]
MKGIFLALFISIGSPILTQAQLRIAIAVGGHQADVIEKKSVPGSDGGYSGRGGAHFGFIADLPFSPDSKFFFQPGVVFYNKGRKFADSVNTINGNVYQSRKQFINYIDIPVNIVAKLRMGPKSKFIIGGGPYASFFYNGKEISESFGQNNFFESEENEDPAVGKGPGQYRVLNFGLNALAGVEFGRVFLTLNYSRGLNDFYQARDYEASFKHQVIGGTLCVFIGKPVALEPRVIDRDKDGIADETDSCPDDAGPQITMGCPDRDGDGIADKDDTCPDQPGILALKGCPIVDKDNDGVRDDQDKCPDIPGLARFDGCPPTDSDKDGIMDEEDKCPEVAGFGRYGGCPIPDKDEDGVNDEVDKCPEVKGTLEKNGCPEEIQKEIVEKINYAAKRIQFRVNKADLLPGSFKILDEVASLLEANPELKLSIEGHTSADGPYELNVKLSQARADKVKAYL